MRVFHFGAASRRLLATLHAPERSRPRTAGVLLCNPFGEEATRAHRLYRVMASQIERAGYPALRFDYSSTGDSQGESENASIGAWLADIALAAAELQSATAARRTVVVGMRFGATLAALATARAGVRVRHLILWDPVVDGRAYLAELAAQHRDYMREEIEGWRDRLGTSAEGFPSEALGVPIAPVLAGQIAAIDLANEEVRADYVTIINTHEPTPALGRFIARLAPQPATTLISVDAGASWNTDAALNASTVPIDVIRAVIGRIQEVSP